MTSLRDYRHRISSVKSTRKITSAMKMVAASKLRRMQEQEEDARPYAIGMAAMLRRIMSNVPINSSSPKLIIGTGSDVRHLMVIVTADRGLCGGFNANVVREAKAKIRELLTQDKEVTIMCVGSKGFDSLRHTYGDKVVKQYKGITGKGRVTFENVRAITLDILGRFENDEFDVCDLFYSNFKSLMLQVPDAAQLIPFNVDKMVDSGARKDEDHTDTGQPYNFEPEDRSRFEDLLKRNIGVQVFRSLLESAAGEQAARMTAMDGATRNAGDMIDDLTIRYNTARQAQITKELIEIISGAEAA